MSLAMHWGLQALKYVYYLSALLDTTVYATMRDRDCRELWLEMLYETDTIIASTISNEFIPDISSSSWLSLYLIQILLPMPDWIIHPLLSFPFQVTLGVLNATDSSLASPFRMAFRDKDDVMALSCSFGLAFDQVMAFGQMHALPTTSFDVLKTHLAPTQRSLTEPMSTVEALMTQIQPSKASRAISQSFLVRLMVTLVATLSLWLYFYHRQ